jgi:conjugative relaxase-like TrwC/TraI family protein
VNLGHHTIPGSPPALNVAASREQDPSLLPHPAYAEEHIFFSRSGTNGIVQEQIGGVVATAFDHWDSRAGDPQLHTHVVVLNRAQSLDGTWRTLDSRGLFKQVVTLSELHEGILADILTDRLGWGFDPRVRKYSAEPKYEVTGVSDALMREFSQRSAQIETDANALIAAFAATHTRQPSTVGVIRLRRLRHRRRRHRLRAAMDRRSRH